MKMVDMYDVEDLHLSLGLSKWRGNRNRLTIEERDELAEKTRSMGKHAARSLIAVLAAFTGRRLGEPGFMDHGWRRGWVYSTNDLPDDIDELPTHHVLYDPWPKGTLGSQVLGNYEDPGYKAQRAASPKKKLKLWLVQRRARWRMFKGAMWLRRARKIS